MQTTGFTLPKLIGQLFLHINVVFRRIQAFLSENKKSPPNSSVTTHSVIFERRFGSKTQGFRISGSVTEPKPCSSLHMHVKCAKFYQNVMVLSALHSLTQSNPQNV
ncbi:hypothetical protein AMECASPLE_004307 [Ameca splendens]|uniref:Uncharacterized protein n=1 Tax=Ameca splendens TaxID=208324 RepID=A0ABV1A784_9TELE